MAANSPPNPYLTVQEAADRMRVHPQSVYRLCYRGELGYTRIGRSVRILETELDAFMARPQTLKPWPRAKSNTKTANGRRKARKAS